MSTEIEERPDKDKKILISEPPPATIVDWMQGRMQTDKLFRALLVLLITIASIYVLSIVWAASTLFSSLILLFMVSWTVALLLTPPIRLLLGLGLPKALAIVVAYLLFLGIIALLLLLFLPDLIKQTQDLTGNLGNIFNSLLTGVNGILQGWGLQNLDLSQFSSQLQTFGLDALKGALNTLTGLPGFLLQIILVLIISASLLGGQDYQMRNLKKSAKKSNSLWSQLPFGWRRWLYLLGQSFESNIGVFLGSQITIGIVYGFIVSLAMTIANYPYAVSTGVFCGVLMIIPFFGGFLSLLPPLLVAVGADRGIAIWIVLAVILSIQTVLLNVIQPRMVGERSGLGPVATLFVLLAGAQVGGVWGVFLGVPLAGVAKNMFDYSLAIILKNNQNDLDESAESTTKAEEARGTYPKRSNSRVDRVLAMLVRDKYKE